MHLLRVSIDLVAGRDLGTLIEARLHRPRLHLTSSLAPIQAAGRALRWLRAVAPVQTPEPGLWEQINALLDTLDDADSQLPALALLGSSGLRILAHAGWGLDLSGCVRCGTACPLRSRVTVDVLAGGIVCRRCGGGSFDLSAEQRRRLIAALEGQAGALAEPADAERAIELVELALATHSQGA